MREHIWEKHTNCEIPNCNICLGGLASCIICGAAECQLPKECPGVKMTTEQKEQMYQRACSCGAPDKVDLRRLPTYYADEIQNWMVSCEQCYMESNATYQEWTEEYEAGLL